ncbi:hypothetical protein [Methyloceanibacter stevinii]|nr:hypothetical protein [Methyloceanibacter stevinii]
MIAKNAAMCARAKRWVPRDAAKANTAIGWEEILFGSEHLVIDDILKAHANPSTERELRSVQQELQRTLSKLAAIEQSTALAFRPSMQSDGIEDALCAGLGQGISPLI